MCFYLSLKMKNIVNRVRNLNYKYMQLFFLITDKKIDLLACISGIVHVFQIYKSYKIRFEFLIRKFCKIQSYIILFSLDIRADKISLSYIYLIRSMLA